MNLSDSSQSSFPSAGSSRSTVIASAQSSNVIDVSKLYVVAESLLGQATGAGDTLCLEVAALTCGRARLQLFHGQVSGKRQAITSQTRVQQVPVAFGGYTYGMLWVASDPEHPAQPAITDPIARDLARACGCVLRLLEQAALVRALSRDLPVEILVPLTRRQHEILQLLAQGYSDDEIVEALHISPETLRKHRQQIYQRMGVHHTYEVLLTAHTTHLVSYLLKSR